LFPEKKDSFVRLRAGGRKKNLGKEGIQPDYSRKEEEKLVPSKEPLLPHAEKREGGIWRGKDPEGESTMGEKKRTWRGSFTSSFLTTSTSDVEKKREKNELATDWERGRGRE